MREFEEITVKEIKKLPTSVTCNKCGKRENLTGNIHQRETQIQLFHAIELVFGYGSSYDEEIWDFDLCEDCLVEFVKSFKHPPNISGY